MERTAVILAAGISTRLLPLTKDRPKPMLLVGGKPMLAYVIEWLKKNNVKKIIITTHYQPEKIINHFGDGSDYGVKIYYSYEDRLLDTAGSLKKNEHILGDDFLVMSGSYYLPSLNLDEFWKFHETKNGIGTIAFKYYTNINVLKNLGQGVIDSNNQLVYFEEKPVNLISQLAHTTYQIYSPRIFNYIPENTPYSLPKDLIPKLLKLKERIYSFVLPPRATLVAISTKEMYSQAKRIISKYKQTMIIQHGLK